MEDPPVSISNTEVKLHSAYDTWRAAAWESRSLPVCSKRIVQCKYYPFCIKFVKSKRDSVRSKLYRCGYIISRNRKNELATVGTKSKPDFQSSESCRFAQKRLITRWVFFYAKHLGTCESCLFAPSIKIWMWEYLARQNGQRNEQNKSRFHNNENGFYFVARHKGFEPLTFIFVVCYSIQLS